MNFIRFQNVLCCFAVLCLCVSVGAAKDFAESLTLEDAIERLEMMIDRSSTTNSGADVRQAAAALGYVLDREGIESAAGELALGNAYFIGDDVGRAILHYRRGLIIDPSDVELKQNLEHARSFVEPTVPDESGGWSAQSVLLSWQRAFSRWTLWYGVVCALGISSCLWTIRIVRSGSRLPLKLPVGFAAVGFLGAGLLEFDQWVVDQERAVVIVSPGTGLYSGPGVGVYQEIYDGSLGVGTEAVLLDQRGAWANIRLVNAQDGWVLMDSFESVGGGVID
jgi:hypothetical protein